MSEKKLMAAACPTPEEEKECVQECMRCCYEAGCDAQTVMKAKSVGISFGLILQMVLTYGPVAVKIIQGILDQLKQVAPMENAGNGGNGGNGGKKKK